MLKLITLIFFISISSLNAAIITVDNKAPSVGDKILQEAYDNMAKGYRIYPGGISVSSSDITLIHNMIPTTTTGSAYAKNIGQSNIQVINNIITSGRIDLRNSQDT